MGGMFVPLIQASVLFGLFGALNCIVTIVTKKGQICEDLAPC